MLLFSTHKRETKAKKYFQWLDPPHRDEVLSRLVRKVQRLEDMVRKQRVKEWRLKVMFCGS